MNNHILIGDALDELKKLENDSIDLVCTDPPYGYSFMGKDWDKAVPHVEIWEECLRVLKPGAFCFVMSAPRSDVQMHMIQNLSEAGFRLDFTPIYWTYASGFPNAGNIGKLVDKRLGVKREVVGTKKHGKPSMTATNGWNANNMEANSPLTIASSPQAKLLDGSYAGFQPKPAVEVIIVAMKPLSEKTFVDQALANGKGITWLDDVRIPTDSADFEKSSRKNFDGKKVEWNGETNTFPTKTMRGDFRPEGRFPANLLVSDDVLNDGVERKSTGGTNKVNHKGLYGGYSTEHKPFNFGDSGSYSRYFDLDKWASTLPFLIVPKASKGEKNKGLEHYPDREPNYGKNMSSSDKGTMSGSNLPTKNGHPTVKPLKLMSYLITLGSRKGDIILDPFVGSGTTCLAAKKLGREYIGIEREPEYVEIAKARLKQEVQASLL